MLIIPLESNNKKQWQQRLDNPNATHHNFCSPFFFAQMPLTTIFVLPFSLLILLNHTLKSQILESGFLCLEKNGKEGGAEEMKNQVLMVVGKQEKDHQMNSQKQVIKTELQSQTQQHPYAFHVSGPRNVPCLNWRDLISSSWKDSNYKRTVIACFIQAVYLLELDRQENRTTSNALAPNWWIPFKYKPVKTLIDERDGSIFGAILEWDRSAALADYVLIRPSGAPRAVLALRGTLLKSSTIRRDIEDDLRFLAWESLKGSVRFNCAFKALKSISKKYGSNNVCIAGHSLGAGFALQVGKLLAKEGILVEAHLFNPPSVSLASSIRNMSERAGVMWNRVRSMLPSSNETQDNANEVIILGSNQWVPHLYVNNSDYICCYYNDADGTEEGNVEKENLKPTGIAKLFVLSKGKQKFLEAHGLEQWWSDDLELQMAVNNSKLISRQLKSLYSLPPPQQLPSKAR